MRYIKVTSRRATAQRTLADRKRQAVHHSHERDDTAGLAIKTDRLADPAHVAPIRADAAATARQPDIPVPGSDHSFEAVVDAVQITADGKSASPAAVRQSWSRRH